MLRDSITLADVRSPTIEIVCEPCDRRGRYNVARLIAKHGPDMRLPELLTILAALKSSLVQHLRPMQSALRALLRALRLAPGRFPFTRRRQSSTRPTYMLVNTGAAYVTLTREHAAAVGFDPQTLRFTGTSNTATGTWPSAPLWLKEVDIGGIKLHDIQGSCCTAGTRSLLGMSALMQLDIRIVNGAMYLAAAAEEEQP
jgi:clan AA aspartic protease (TIGR02281 family)